MKANTRRLSAVTLVAAGLVLALVAAGCSTNQSLATQIDDTAIVAKVKTKIAADPEINPFRINVDSNEGVVRLSGSVEKSEARSEAVKHAKSTTGVVRVINDLEIGSETLGERIDDATLSARVKTRMARDPEVKALDIDVDAEDGVVILQGRVDTRAQKQEAEYLAYNTKGVWKVRNLLKVGPQS